MGVASTKITAISTTVAAATAVVVVVVGAPGAALLDLAMRRGSSRYSLVEYQLKLRSPKSMMMKKLR